jgi:hypothetical protein
MDFGSAMYNCLLRRMELVAFDTDKELHPYWSQSSYYGKTINIGKNSRKIKICGQKSVICVDIHYFWTSGVATTQKPTLKIIKKQERNGTFVTWCSTNTTFEMRNKVVLGKGKKRKCMAYERWTNRLRMLDCGLQLSFICEV